MNPTYYHVYWFSANSWAVPTWSNPSADSFISTLDSWNTNLTLLGGQVYGVVVEECDSNGCSQPSSPAIIDTGYTTQQQSDSQAQCAPTIQPVIGDLLSGTYSINKCMVDAISNLSTTIGSLDTVWQDIVSLFPKITAVLKKACPVCGLVIDLVATYISYTLKQFQTVTQSCDPAYFDITAVFIVTKIRCSQYTL